MRICLPSCTANRSSSSSRWLQRSRNDPFRNSKSQYVARSAHKLLELDDKYKLLRGGSTVLELGAAPGGWTEVCLERMRGHGKIVTVDLLPLDIRVSNHSYAQPCLQHVIGDIRDEDTLLAVEDALASSPVEVVLSDMLANTSGNAIRDRQSSLDLCECVFAFARRLFQASSLDTTTLIMKILYGPEAIAFERGTLRMMFEHVRWEKPAASAKASNERYIVCRRFRHDRGDI